MSLLMQNVNLFRKFKKYIDDAIKPALDEYMGRDGSIFTKGYFSIDDVDYCVSPEFRDFKTAIVEVNSDFVIIGLDIRKSMTFNILNFSDGSLNKELTAKLQDSIVVNGKTTNSLKMEYKPYKDIKYFPLFYVKKEDIDSYAISGVLGKTGINKSIQELTLLAESATIFNKSFNMSFCMDWVVFPWRSYNYDIKVDGSYKGMSFRS